MSRPRRQRWLVTVVAVLALGLPALLAACSSGGASGSGGGGSDSSAADAKLQSAGTTVEKQMAEYQRATQNCRSEASPVVCVEAADRTLGGQVHTYANLLATGKGFTASEHLLAGARNNAQTLANSLEILGDAQPTQINYDQVLNTFDVNGALSQLRSAIKSLDHSLRG